MRVSARLHPVLAAAVALAATLTVALPLPASAEPTVATFVADGDGYNGVYEGRAAGFYRFDIDGTEVVAFCVEMTKDLNRNANFTAVPLAEAGITGIAQAAWIGANHQTYGTPLAAPQAEAAAAQVAIWIHTNGITLDETSLPNSEIRNRAQELAAAAGTIASTPTSYDLTLSGEAGEDGKATFVATATTEDGTPVENINVYFSTGDIVTTDADGKASVMVEAAPGEEVTVSADATFGILAGYALVPDDGSQTLVAVEPATVSHTAEATVVVPEAPTTTTTTTTDETDDTTTTTTTTTTDEDDTTDTTIGTTTTTEGDTDITDRLPHTGGNGGMWMLVVAGVGGLAAIIFLRRGAEIEED